MPRRLLIVDDNPDFCRLVQQLLELDGYEVVGTEHDGASGLAAAEALSPEVVLLDVQLPDVSGFDLATRLVHEQPGAIVVLTSTHDREDFERLALDSGARGFISKAELTPRELDGLLTR
ncbi:MAG: response regulator transcription factor [Solirubrobacteraceae bacterium]